MLWTHSSCYISRMWTRISVINVLTIASLHTSRACSDPRNSSTFTSLFSFFLQNIHCLRIRCSYSTHAQVWSGKFDRKINAVQLTTLIGSGTKLHLVTQQSYYRKTNSVLRAYWSKKHEACVSIKMLFNVQPDIGTWEIRLQGAANVRISIAIYENVKCNAHPVTDIPQCDDYEIHFWQHALTHEGCGLANERVDD